MKQFIFQSGCHFKIRTGVQENQNTFRESSAISFHQSLFTYSISQFGHVHVCVREEAKAFKTFKEKQARYWNTKAWL